MTPGGGEPGGGGRGPANLRRCGPVLLLLLAGGLGCGAEPAAAQAASASDPPAVAFRLGDPTPNPFQEEVRIPFELGPEAPTGTERGRGPAPAAGTRDSAAVSLAVYNVLYQRVAWARTPPDGEAGLPVRERRYAVPGRYEVVWNGRADGGRRVPAGPYFLELVVDGRTAVRKVILTR